MVNSLFFCITALYGMLNIREYREDKEVDLMIKKSITLILTLTFAFVVTVYGAGNEYTV